MFQTAIYQIIIFELFANKNEFVRQGFNCVSRAKQETEVNGVDFESVIVCQQSTYSTSNATALRLVDFIYNFHCVPLR